MRQEETIKANDHHCIALRENDRPCACRACKAAVARFNLLLCGAHMRAYGKGFTVKIRIEKEGEDRIQTIRRNI